MRFGTIRIYFSNLRIFAGVRQATARDRITRCTFRLYTGCLSVCVPASLFICLSLCLCTCFFVYLSVYLSICLSVYMSVCLSICLLLLLLDFKIFFLLLCQDPQYVSVGTDGEASAPQELKQVGILTFSRCFVTFCVSGTVWTISLNLTYIYFFILKSYVVCELQDNISLIYSFIKNIWKIRFWFSCLVVNR